jgi:hypothetical protein
MAQRRVESMLHRPLKTAVAVAAAVAALAVLLAAVGVIDVLVAGLGVICCALVAAVSGCAIWQGERALRSRLAEERVRVERIRAAQESQLFARQSEHADRVRQWQARRVAYEHQKRWYAVCAPSGAHRVDVAGGTLSGWSAMLATAGAYRLAAGAEVTVLDLTEGSVALDLIGFARTSGIDPLVWVLPDDLPGLDVGTALAPLPRSTLRVVALSQQADAAEGRLLGTHLAVALTHALRGTERGHRWQHTLFVLAADRLCGDTLDRLSDVCESTGTGLVLAYRTIPPQVRQRLGGGNAAVAFMRPGNAEDAKAASEQLGTGHCFVLSQLTETIGLSVADTTGSSYTSSTGSVRPSAPWSTGESDPVSAGISSSTAWGQSTSKVTGDSESLARAQQRSREFRAEQHELTQLPASAMIITYAGPAGPQAVMADANPGLAALSTATPLTLEEFTGLPAETAPVSWRAGSNQPSPNLGPPPPRLDWRKQRP